MARPRNEHDWKKIDPLLLMACMAFTKDDRDQLLGKITSRYGMHRTTLSRRLEFIGARFISPDAGPAALEAYERNMLRVIKFEKMYAKLRKMLMTKTERIRDAQKARLNASISIRQAARTLQVRPETLRRWIEDLGAIELDEKGRVPRSELRKFAVGGEWKWLLPGLRLRRVVARPKPNRQCEGPLWKSLLIRELTSI